jgi:hypothetical protein
VHAVGAAANFTTSTISPLRVALASCTAQPHHYIYAHNGYAASCRPAIGRRRPRIELLRQCSTRLCLDGAPGEGGGRTGNGDAKHAGAQVHTTRTKIWCLTRCAVCPPRRDHQAQEGHREPGRRIQREGRVAAQIRTVPHVVSAEIRPTVRHYRIKTPVVADGFAGSPYGRTS